MPKPAKTVTEKRWGLLKSEHTRSWERAHYTDVYVFDNLVTRKQLRRIGYRPKRIVRVTLTYECPNV